MDKGALLNFILNIGLNDLRIYAIDLDTYTYPVREDGYFVAYGNYFDGGRVLSVVRDSNAVTIIMSAEGDIRVRVRTGNVSQEHDASGDNRTIIQLLEPRMKSARNRT